MVDYSRFNNIEDSDEEGEQHRNIPVQYPTNSGTVLQPMAKKATNGRLKFEHQGNTIYEWEQNLSEVIIYIQPPQGVTAKMLDIKISAHHLKIAIKGTPPYIDEDTGSFIKVSESTWIFDEGEIVISLQKMNKAETWECALRGHQGQVVDEFTKEEMKKKILLERFQEEHPGFDFSGADFNGNIPDARDFMGGVKHF